MKTYALYNPYSGNNTGETKAKELAKFYEGKELVFVDMTKVEDYAAWTAEMTAEDEIIVCGGDGTLNVFANAVKGLKIEQNLLYYACGSGNDFLRDIGDNEGKLVRINGYLQDLPTVTVKGKEYAFINGVGYGIDGYCCEVGDKLRAEKPGQQIDYTGIAIKGLLFHYKPVDATVTVDGKDYYFKKVWLAPTMNGKYYGGGMIPAPEQKRLDEDKKLSVMVFCGKSKLKTLMIFPSLFKGEHIKHKKAVGVLSGKEIKVEYDRPTPLQIDGETILGVTSYTARV
jgi:diacylglycerol kinase family enzyme